MTLQYICNRCGGVIDTDVGSHGKQVIVPEKWKPAGAQSSTTVFIEAQLAEANGPVRQHFCRACLVVLLHDAGNL